MKKMIYTTNAPKPIGQYSQAIRVGNTVYISGQIALQVTTNELMIHDIQQEVIQIFENINAIAKEAGGSLNDIVALTVYLMKLSDVETVNEMITRYFDQPWPARASVQVAKLPRGANVEIAAVMVLS